MSSGFIDLLSFYIDKCYKFLRFTYSLQIKKWCGVTQLWCGVAQLIARRLAVRQARVRFSARHHREVFPTELTSDEEMERDLGEWRRINVLNKCD